VILDVKADGGIEFMTRASSGAETTFIAGTTQSFPVYLTLERHGSTVTGYVLDGTHLTEVGSVTVDLPATALIGLAVTSHDAGTLATGVFDGVSQ
jgi:hypothetical protein